MNIKEKLYLLGAVAVVGVVSVVLVTTQFTHTTDSLHRATNLVAQLEIRLLNLRRNEKDFLLRKDAKYLKKFNDNMGLFLDKESQLSEILVDHDLPPSSQLKVDILKYQESFQNLVAGFEKLGLNNEEKLLGAYYSEVANLENKLAQRELAQLYNFDKQVQVGQLDESLINFAESSQLIQDAKLVIAQKKEIGLKYNEGLLGQTRAGSHKVEKQFKEFAKELNDTVEAKESQLFLFKQALTGFVILVIVLIVYQISRSINTQVTTLLKVIENIASTNNVGQRSSLSGNNELSSISKYFDRLMDKLEDLISGTQDKSAKLSASTSNMNSVLENVMEQFHTQANYTSTMTTSIQEMVTTINEISESTTVAAEGVQQASENAQNGRDVVEKTVDDITQLSSTLDASQESISSLNHHVEEIGSAVTIIQGIAEQTNLLALNAAIEAARAGEQGRGFAVVADEVRALASRTHQSTEDITNVVSSIQTQMSKVVVNMEQCDKQGKSTLEASKTLDASLSHIISDMQSIQENSERIAAAIEEQGVVVNQVADSITELNSISENNMSSAQACLEEVNSVSTQSQEMDNAVAEFKTSDS
ncbi:methyl-accepting chemotaxis protein [Vibrio sp. S4M6]|uniref:methyl-accepting chemotaxis protein n=1 Tax=Vibrio sinus TaxID=2946865 RepID=UPI002029E4F1|nr:methyl-accepting chemotaxis protein [Vibrio sinus]MCL9779931.1 methyl-accepting chemotaxis protein [Vibrio sinus]